MSTRAAKMLVDDMQAMGAVRLRNVDEAQALLVKKAEDLAAKGAARRCAAQLRHSARHPTYCGTYGGAPR
jgi:hypothetical protein